MINGLDFLGLGSKHWQVDESIKAFPQGFALGAFDKNVFGDALPAIRKFLASGKVGALRVHLWYTSGHKLCPLSVIKERAPLYEKLSKDFPDVMIYLSHTCEFMGGTIAEVRQRVDLLKKLAPHCIPVNSGAIRIVGVPNEYHAQNDDRNKLTGYKALRCKAGDLCSTDGKSAPQLNFTHWKAYQKQASINFAWASRFNLREEYDKPSDMPAPKDRKAYPDEMYIKAVAALFRDEGVAPPFKLSGKVINITNPSVLKTFAEDGLGEDVRSNKPLLISPAPTGKTLKVLACNGRQVAYFKYFGHYPTTKGQYQRHYSGTGSNLYGFQIANKAIKTSGSPFVWFTADSKVFYGPVNPIFRKGYF